ncbi:MAG: HAD hydrolase family protein [Myxococcota bacterium]|jgi:YrbI family 3-deoxy-D-manno-octulosonate 8-phosphate phosphatase|nr:HAD hydrolase family protein [Myxococcota bacterium]
MPEQAKLSVAELDLMVYDFDGVMTDNRVLVLEDGREAIFAHRGDGFGTELIRQKGLAQLILTTEKNPVVRKRAEKLKLEIIHSCENKERALRDFCKEKGYELARVFFIGNDLNDFDALKIVGYPAAPSDAHPRVLEIARFITNAQGGYGVVREIADRLVD